MITAQLAHGLATALYGRLVLDPHGGLLLYSNAGHPPPLLGTADGTVTALTSALSPPLGAPLPVSVGRGEAAVDLPSGSTLLLYTDGLVEGRRAPGSSHRYGEESLSAWLDGVAPAPRRVDAADLDHLLVDVEAANGGPLLDDVAVVVLSSRPASAPLPTSVPRPRTVALP